MIQNFSSADRTMEIPEILISILREPIKCGEDLISSTRAVMFYLGDMLANDDEGLIVPFQSIDSQTDHIELAIDRPFRLPSPRVGLDSSQGKGRLISSSVNATVGPNDPAFQAELSQIFRAFSDLYVEAVAELLSADT